MSLTDELRDPRHPIQGIIFSSAGYTCHFQRDSNTSSKLQGYESFKEELRTLMDERKVPFVVLSEAAEAFAWSLPIMFGDDMRDGPIGALSNVPFQVYASLAHRLGSEVGNVEVIDFIPEMFKSEEARAKDSALVTRIMGNDPQAMLDGLLNGRPTSSFVVPSEPAFSSFQKLHAHVTDELSRRQELAAELDAKSKAMLRSDEPMFDKPEYRENSAAQMTNDVVLQRLRYLKQQIAWSALMVKAGNYTHEQGLLNISQFADKTKSEVTEIFRGQKGLDHYKQALRKENLGGVLTTIGKLVKAAQRTIDRDSLSESSLAR